MGLKNSEYYYETRLAVIGPIKFGKFYEKSRKILGKFCSKVENGRGKFHQRKLLDLMIIQGAPPRGVY